MPITPQKASIPIHIQSSNLKFSIPHANTANAFHLLRPILQAISVMSSPMLCFSLLHMPSPSPFSLTSVSVFYTLSIPIILSGARSLSPNSLLFWTSFSTLGFTKTWFFPMDAAFFLLYRPEKRS